MTNSEDFEQANQRAAARKDPVALAAQYDPRIQRIVISLSTGLDISFLPEAAQGLEGATPSELEEIEISPSGLGIHFPKLDADLYLPALMQGFFGSESWMAAHLGARGGAAKSEAKTAAARKNGARGGRPKEVAVNQ